MIQAAEIVFLTMLLWFTVLGVASLSVSWREEDVKHGCYAPVLLKKQ